MGYLRRMRIRDKNKMEERLSETNDEAMETEIMKLERNEVRSSGEFQKKEPVKDCKRQKQRC